MDPLNGFRIEPADPGDPRVRPLIEAHLAHSGGASPDASNHSMDIQALQGSGIRFWAVSDLTGVVGCGALKPLPDGTVEVKSVHVSKTMRGRGLARMLVMYLIETARLEGARALVLETGSMAQFDAARGLYEALGFIYCSPIPGYRPDPNSAFMRLPLDPVDQRPQERPTRSRSSTG